MSLHSSRIAREQFDVVRVASSADEVLAKFRRKQERKKTIDCSPGVVVFISSGGIPFITVHVGTGPWTGLPFITVYQAGKQYRSSPLSRDYR